MSSPLRPLLAIALVFALPALAGDRMAVKPGLWEITHASASSGMPPMPAEVLAQMPAEQRARIEAAMKARGAGRAHGDTVRECITDQDLDQAFKPDADSDNRCTHTIVSRTANSMEMKMECSGMGQPGGTAHGTFKWRAPTPESMTGSIEMQMSDGAHSMTHTTQLSGKWLGSNCGNLKPRAHKDR